MRPARACSPSPTGGLLQGADGSDCDGARFGGDPGRVDQVRVHHDQAQPQDRPLQLRRGGRKRSRSLASGRFQGPWSRVCRYGVPGRDRQRHVNDLGQTFTSGADVLQVVILMCASTATSSRRPPTLRCRTSSGQGSTGSLRHNRSGSSAAPPTRRSECPPVVGVGRVHGRHQGLPRVIRAVVEGRAEAQDCVAASHP